jgi:hypothetical protein
MRSDEQDLVRALLSGIYPESEIDLRLARAIVQDMSDDGMGSIRFGESASKKRHFGQVAAAADYVDQDGVLVSITLNLDGQSDLFEVDFWKVDFSPLLRYPRPQDLRLREVVRAASTTSETALASHP